MLLSCLKDGAKFYLFSTENHSLLGPDDRCFCCCLPHKLKMMVLFFQESQQHPHWVLLGIKPAGQVTSNKNFLSKNSSGKAISNLSIMKIKSWQQNYTEEGRSKMGSTIWSILKQTSFLIFICFLTLKSKWKYNWWNGVPRKKLKFQMADTTQAPAVGR